MATPVEVSSEDPVKSKRPSSSAFKQQRLPAWQPILTAGTVLPTFFVIGIAFIPIGIGLLISSDGVQEVIVDYTDCDSIDVPGKKCSEVIDTKNGTSCLCREKFNLKENYKSDVFMYYGLTNYYQNHRRYVKSRDDNQLLGHLNNEVSNECEPFAYDESSKDKKKKAIAPCGAIANSLFNDTFTLVWMGKGSSKARNVPILKTGIAWPTDKSIKFRNPEGNMTEEFKKFSKPPYWQKAVYELDVNDSSNNGFQNEDLIIWMRTAALPTFRKLYGRVDHQAEGFIKQIPQGEYQLEIKYSYPVKSFDGRKRMILSTTSWLGGKNPFLGIAYIVVGCVCLVLGIVFLVIHIKFGKSTQDMMNISQRTGY